MAYRIHVRDTAGTEHRLVTDAESIRETVRRMACRLEYRGLRIAAIILILEI